MNYRKEGETQLDHFTRGLLEDLFTPTNGTLTYSTDLANEVKELLEQSNSTELTSPITRLFTRLKEIKNTVGLRPDDFGISREALTFLCEKHKKIDEHGVTVGGRVNEALLIVEKANKRIENYLTTKDTEAPSGIELWDKICENIDRIKSILNIDNENWNSYSGQLKHCIDSVEKLSKIINLPAVKQFKIRVDFEV